MTRTVRLTTNLPAAPVVQRRLPTTLPWWVLVLVMGVALAVYANSLRNGFALDDLGIIVNNPAVTELQWTEIWSGSYWPGFGAPPADLLYRPLTIFSYLVNYSLTPDSTWSYHLVNIALHALCCGLVSLLAWRLLRHTALALVAGLLFAIHPMHTEVVANVVGRAELLAAVWCLLALLIFLPADLPHDNLFRSRRWPHGLLVAACFLLGLLSKETPAPFLLAFPLIDYWRWRQADPLTRPRRGWWQGRCLKYYLPLLGAFLIYLLLRIHAVGIVAEKEICNPIVNPLMTASLAERIVTPFVLLAKYFALFTWPQVLACDYSAPSLPPTANPLAPLALLGELLVLLGVWLLRTSWRRRPTAILLLVLFAVSYALIANVLRIGTIFGERLFYWPSVFVCLGAAYAALAAWRRLSTLTATPAGGTPVLRNAGVPPVVGRTVAVLLAVTVTGLLSWRTIVRNADWADNYALIVSTARDNPRSARAMAWAGHILVSSEQPAWQDFGSTLLARAIDLYPRNAPPYLDLANYHHMHHREGDALITLARMALADGGHPDARKTIMVARDDLRNLPPDRYLPVVTAWIQDHPNDPASYLAQAWCARALGRLAEAEDALTQALTIKPGFDEAGAELGLLRLERGNAAGAVPLLRRYALRATRSAEARCQVAFALLKLDPRQYPDAADEAERALASAQKLDPLGHDAKIRELRAEMRKVKAAARAPTAPPALPVSSS